MSSTPDLLPAHTWETSYRHEDGDLVRLFYVPALSCALQYDLMTGYFSATALALAARGIERLTANGGRMRLIVGCTLDDAEIAAIERGYDFRQQVTDHLLRANLTPPDLKARNGLEALAWMIGRGLLDVKVAVPVAPGGRPTTAPGIYHEKVGIITDAEGNRLSFSGSINETANGWINNRESFHVHCSWEGGRESKHVLDEVEAFDRLWEDRAASTKVFEFPEAAKTKLLQFLPSSDRFVTPPGLLPPAPEPTDQSPGSAEVGPVEHECHRLTPGEVRRIVWAYIREAPRLKNGIRVGEVTSVVKPWPHQTRTFKQMIDQWPCRLLLSDEVGLGKTISAGLLIRQAWLSGLARRILILAPKAVLTQWQNELYEKFNLNVPIYDGQRLAWRPAYGRQGPLERKVERDQWHREPFVLCSNHLVRRRDRARELLEAEPWDLLVLDEAHHARRKSPGTPQEGGPNALLRLMLGLKDRCRSLLLLTATPMQVHPVEVWDLLNLLGLPPRWALSSADFVRYFQAAAANPSQPDFEFLAALFRDVERTFGPVDEELVGKVVPAATKLARERVLKALRDEKSGIPLKRLSAADRQAALEVLRRFSPIRYRMSRHTRGLLRLYYEKGLLETPIASRDVRDAAIEMAPSERALYEAVEDYISTTYNNAAANKRTAVGFVMTIYQRRLASSFFALRQTLNNHFKAISGGQPPLPVEDEDLSQDESADETQDPDEATAWTREALLAQERAAIQYLLLGIAKLGTDTKAKRAKAELQQAFADGYASAIVFTQYTDTMDYIKEYLAVELPGVPIACYSGAGGQRRDIGGFWTPCTKEQIKLAFKNRSVRLLICTDAAGEGLNFQTCGMLLNYDLPWNPMKVEQRIGRIDRIGQLHPTIRVVNLAYKDTVEADVYFSLGRRINLFQGIVGKLQPILSRLPREFEKVALERPEHREAARQRLIADADRLAEEAREAGFDIDEVAAEALEMPQLPPPALTLAELDRALNRPDVRPPEAVWKPLDPGSYALQVPGMSEEMRVTTSAEVFDDHSESHAFLSPGGECLDELAPEDTSPSVASGSAQANIWLVEPVDHSRPAEVVALTIDGPRLIDSLGMLIDCLDHLAAPAQLDPTTFSDSTTRPLA